MREELVRLFTCFAVLGLVSTTAIQAADPSLIGYWPFDEASGDTASDASGNGNDGTLSANVGETRDAKRTRVGRDSEPEDVKPARENGREGNSPFPPGG